MQLWLQWWSVVAPLRQTCRDKRTFLWPCTALAGFCVRPDLLGVSSTVRALGLAARCYDRLLDFFHSSAIEPDTLSRLWTRLALQRFTPHRLGGRLVLLGDGIKIPKSGRKMPAVKRLHQASENNTKPEFIMGHSVQVVSVIETIDYWVKGLADGNDGEFPELCFEFPYLQGYEDVDALTVAYCVDNEDGTRTELNRVTLERVLMQLLENDPPARMKRRTRVTAAKLRDLAEKIEKIVPHSPGQDGPSLVPPTR